MALESELVRLILYSAQQLGVTLAVGGQTILLVAYLIAMRDRVVEAKETQFSRAVRAVLFSGLGLMILSGLGIAGLHYLAGELSILLAPAFLFKWVLVVAVLLFGLGIGGGLISQWVGEGLAGGTWYALFFLHILAPVASWENLLILYAGWLVAFFLLWVALVFGTRERATAPATGAKKITPIPTPPVAPKVSQNKPVPVPLSQPLSLPNIPSVNVQFSTSNSVLTPLPAVPPVPSPTPAPAAMPTPPIPKQALIVDPDAHPGLPAIRVMPKTVEDIDKQHRAAVVKFE